MPMLNVDGWTDKRTDERTNGRKLARLCLPAKAGATKKHTLANALKSMETTSLEKSLNTFAVACHSFLEPLSH